MAVSLRSPQVSDLCIGKPPARSLPPSATVANALAALRRGGAASYVAVVAGDRAPSPEKARDVAGRVGIADVVCFLCADERSLADPAGALRSPVSALLPKGAPPIRRVEPHASVLEVLDVILEGASALAVPLRSGGRRRLSGAAASGGEFCWLAHEDFVRYFLNSIAPFAPVAAHSVAALGLVRPAAPSVRLHDPALSALPLLRRALADGSAVAVLSGAGELAGELSPALLASSPDVTAAAAAVATLSAGELMAFADYASPPESLVRAIKSRLKDRGLDSLLGLLEEEDAADAASVLSVSPSSTSSSSGEESVGPKRRRRRQLQRSGRSLSSSLEVAACHPGSSLMAVMVQAVAHRASHVWVVEEEEEDGVEGGRLVGMVAFADVLRVFREQLVAL